MTYNFPEFVCTSWGHLTWRARKDNGTWVQFSIPFQSNKSQEQDVYEQALKEFETGLIHSPDDDGLPEAVK